MKAVVIRRFGGPEVLQIAQVADPVVNPSEVLVQVKATSVNPLDYQIRRGDYPQEVPLPAIIGHDVAGDVVAVGGAVKDFKVGDAVYYSPGYLEDRAVTPSSWWRGGSRFNHHPTGQSNGSHCFYNR